MKTSTLGYTDGLKSAEWLQVKSLLHILFLNASPFSGGSGTRKLSSLGIGFFSELRFG